MRDQEIDVAYLGEEAEDLRRMRLRYGSTALPDDLDERKVFPAGRARRRSRRRQLTARPAQGRSLDPQNPRNQEFTMHASVHDRIVNLSSHLDEPNRDGEILEVRGAEGASPYQVRWSDTDREGLYSPGTDAVIHHAEPDVSVAGSTAGSASSPPQLTAADALSAMYCLDAHAIDELKWENVAHCTGVKQKVFWLLGDFVQALLRNSPGSATPGVPHLAVPHHIWIVSGAVTIAGRPLGQGSYLHIPPDVAHPAVATEDGCTILQMHRPHPPNEANRLAMSL